jgi:hypothetical protein
LVERPQRKLNKGDVVFLKNIRMILREMSKQKLRTILTYSAFSGEPLRNPAGNFGIAVKASTPKQCTVWAKPFA